MPVILCGTDFSAQARAAASVAAAWAARTGCSVRLVHAWEWWPGDEALLQLQDEACAAMRRQLDDESRRLRREHGVEVECSLVSGRVYEAVLREATTSGAHVIVVASLGRGSHHGWMLGSNAERIAQRATVPVLVVRDAPRLLEWIAQASGQLPVNVAVDLTPASTGALRWARALTQLGPCTLELDYIAWPPSEPHRMDAPPDPTHPGDWSRLEAALMADLALWAGTQGPVTERESLHAEVNWGRPDAAIAALAEAEHSALVVVGSHRRSHIARFWQGSVTRGLLHHVATNIACVPPHEHAVRDF